MTEGFAEQWLREQKWRRDVALTALTPTPRYQAERSFLHGDAHWRAVALAGLWIADRTPGADRAFIVTFAKLHDAQRQSDGRDPDHGARAAQRFQEAPADGYKPRTRRTREMVHALANHTAGVRANTLNVGICWDADRLNLWRVGIVPDRSLLTTPVARTAHALSRGRMLCDAHAAGTLPDWRRIVRMI
jgi:uncharacterized protein